MDENALVQFKDLGAGLILGLSACGSALGAGTAGMAAIGAWKKNFAQNKPASFIIVALVAAPLTQTIYGNIVMKADPTGLPPGESPNDPGPGCPP